MKHIIFILLAVCSVYSGMAQVQPQGQTQSSTETPTDSTITTIPNFFETYSLPKDGYSSVTIEQDGGIEQLISKHIALNVQNESKCSGWRIQIYNSSGVESRKEAQDVRNKFLSEYPNIPAYVIYQPPFFKIRVGDFRTREEAYMIYKQIIQEFPVSYLVNDLINFPKL